MFLAYKPETASLLDMLGPHPYYTISLEFVASIGCFMLYMLFAKREKHMHKELLGS